MINENDGKESKTFNSDRDIKVEGINTFTGGKFNKVKLEGIITLKDDLIAKSLSIEGIFNANGKIISDELYCEGVAKIEGR